MQNGLLQAQTQSRAKGIMERKKRNYCFAGTITLQFDWFHQKQANQTMPGEAQLKEKKGSTDAHVAQKMAMRAIA